MPEIQVKDKLITAEEVKAAYDTLDGSKLENNFSTYTAATLPYANTEKIALRGTDGNNYYTTIGELASQIGGGGGTTQAALVHYVKNCGSISGSGTTLNWTNSQIDNNITENMVVLKAELSNPAAQTSDWTCTTTNGYVTITGTIASGSSTNVLLYFGVSLSTAPSIIVNLASNSSDNVLKTNPTPGVIGVLGTSNGGTGVSANSASALLTNLGAVPKSDLTSIIATGTTNTTGAAIAKGTYFYLNGALVQAKTDIASGATFTSGTNYEAVTAGGLNSLNDQIATQSATVAKANANCTYGNVTFEKTANYVSVMIEGFVSLPTNGYTNICSIPSGFAPSGTRFFDAIIGTDEHGANLRTLRFRINATTLSVYNYSTELTNVNSQPIVMYIR